MDKHNSSALSFWSQTNFSLCEVDCREELCVSANGTRLLQLQSTEDIKFLDETITMRHIFKIVPFVVGVPANVIALVALLTLRPRSIGLFYIALLAASDLGALVMNLVDYLLVDNKIDTPRLLCGLIVTLITFFPCFANWMLVVVSFERYYTLRFPLHKTAHFTFGRARLLVACLGLLLFLYHLPPMFLVEETINGFCKMAENLAITIITVLLHFYVPAVLIFTLVALIAYCLYKASQARVNMFDDRSIRSRSLGSTSSSTSAPTSRSSESIRSSEPRILRRHRRNEHFLTIMMFCAAIFFLVMTLPLMVVFQLESEPMMSKPEMLFHFSLTVCQGLQSLTHVANFFLYFIACKRMRSHLFRMLRLRKLRKRLCCTRNRSPSNNEVFL